MQRQNDADIIHAKIITEFARHAREGFIILSRTELTSRFARTLVVIMQ